MLSHDQARDFYDRFGAKQDMQGFYEDAPIADLCEQSAFEEAEKIFEFGCGTGRLAEHLFQYYLQEKCTYTGVDLSTTMVHLASSRLKRFQDRAGVQRTDGEMRMDAADASCDRVISNYVLDLLTEEDIRAFIQEAKRVLTPEGKLCIVGLTQGCSLVSRFVSRLWSIVHRVRPSLVGGCRPIEVRAYLEAEDWRILHHRTVVASGIASEVLIASPSEGSNEAA